MKTKLFQKIAALAVVSGIALSACGGTSGANSAAAPSSVTTSITQGSSTTSSTDGLALLDSLREISETNLPSGDVYSTSLTGDQATTEKLMAENQKPHADSNDADYDASSATKITLNGTSATVEGSGAEASKGVVTITSEGTYILSGTFDGQIVVAASDEAKVKIVLNEAHISSSTDAAIRVNTADEAVIVLAEGTTNSVSDTSSYASDVSGPTAAIASSSDLTIGGSGTLNVKGNANDGISSADGLVIIGGNINVTAVDDAVRGKDYVVLAEGTLALEAGGDAVKADNETDSGRGYVLLTGGKISGTAGSDLIDATSDVIVAGGSVEATGSEEGIEAAYIYLAGGEGTVKSSDDSINATGGNAPWLNIAGGTWVLKSGGDGIDSNGTAFISGGNVTVWGPNNGGNGSLDAEQGLVVSGGTLFTAGAAGMAQGPNTSSPQASIMVTGSASAGSVMAILDSSGKEIASYTLEVDGQSFIFSSSEIVSGQSYTVTVDGKTVVTAVAGQYNAGGMGGGPMGGGGRP